MNKFTKRLQKPFQLHIFHKKIKCFQCGEYLKPKNVMCEICGFQNLPEDIREREFSSEKMPSSQKSEPVLPLMIDRELLLKHVARGGHSGRLIGDAFLNVYQNKKPFQHSLRELKKLDSEAFSVFFSIMILAHCCSLKDIRLKEIEEIIIARLSAEKRS